MQSTENELEIKGKAAKAASKKLAYLPTAIKNQALTAISDAIMQRQSEILAANEKDYKEAEASGMNTARS